MVNWWYSARVPSTFLLIISLSQGQKPYCLTVRCLWNSGSTWSASPSPAPSSCPSPPPPDEQRATTLDGASSRPPPPAAPLPSWQSSLPSPLQVFSHGKVLSALASLTWRLLSLSHSFQKIRRLWDNAGRLRWTIFKVFIICRFGHGRAFRTNYFFKLGRQSLYTVDTQLVPGHRTFLSSSQCQALLEDRSKRPAAPGWLKSLHTTHWT